MVDRSAFDKIQQAGGYTSINCGAAQDANAILISKVDADEAMDSASCIGCGACIAACKNGSAMLFVSKNKFFSVIAEVLKPRCGNNVSAKSRECSTSTGMPRSLSKR